jgi:acetyl esterase/lipase
MNRVRSSRRLEIETKRNLEVIWLLGKLSPDHKTIVNFRKENAAALKGVFRLTNDSASDLKVLPPMFYISQHVPPALMRYGTIDELVPLSQGVLLKASLDAAGIRNDMFVYQNSGHGLDGPDGKTDVLYRAKLSEYVKEYF